MECRITTMFSMVITTGRIYKVCSFDSLFDLSQLIDETYRPNILIRECLYRLVVKSAVRQID